LQDENSQTLYTITIPVPAYSGTTNIVTATEVFADANLELLKQAQQLSFAITMGAGTALTSTSTGSLQLRSSATAYFNYAVQ
jgi:hypothetical protein